MLTRKFVVLVGAAMLLNAWAISALALPPGFQERTIPTTTSPSGLTYAPDGTLYAAESAPFNGSPPPGSHAVATIQVIRPDGTFAPSISVTGLAGNFFVGNMTYDPTNGHLLITDNAAGANALYSVDPAGGQSTVLSGLSTIQGVAVRNTGEIFVNTAAPSGAGSGQVFQVNRSTGATTSVLTGLDYGAGLAFRPDSILPTQSNLIVQDADATTFTGRLQELPMTGTGGPLVISAPSTLLAGMDGAYGVVSDSQGNLYVTGSGLILAQGAPLTATLFDGNGSQFSTASAFLPGANPFQAFTNDGGSLAYVDDFSSSFITVITPIPEPATWLLAALGSLGLFALSRRSRGKYRGKRPEINANARE